MGFLNKLFGKEIKGTDTITFENQCKDFWDWFVTKEKNFYAVVESNSQVVESFIDVVLPKLKAINENFTMLVGGVSSEGVSEFIVTADGVVKDIVFAEEFIASAPKLERWSFIANKPASGDIGLNMNGYVFNSKTVRFLPLYDEAHPDEIALRFIVDGYKAEEEAIIGNSLYIFLDNYLGELETVTLIDYLEVRGEDALTGEEVPLDKLKEYLVYREKEFIEKYNGIKHNSDDDSHVVCQATFEGSPFFISVNKTLLDWDQKMSYPWIVKVQIPYAGDKNGLPKDKQFDFMNEVEDMILETNENSSNLLFVVRETGNNKRCIYFVAQDFREASKCVNQALSLYTEKQGISYGIYKDKYWFSLAMYNPGESESDDE